MRKVKASTINSYLAGIRQQHIMLGLEPPCLRNNLVKLVLKGKSHMDGIESREAPGRLPMTISMMKLLKQATRSWEANLLDKLLMWAISTVAFHGGFRIHELLCKSESVFDPNFTLLGSDIKIKRKLRASQRESCK